MSITVNQKKIAFVANESVKNLLDRVKYRFPLIIVKINGELVNKKDYDTTIIPDGSTVDVIHLTSGG